MLPKGYYLEWREDGTATLRRSDHTVVAYFGEDATGKHIQEKAQTDKEMNEDEPVKRCHTCKKFKPLVFFHKNRSTEDGLHGRCAPCANASSNAIYRRRYARRSA